MNEEKFVCLPAAAAQCKYAQQMYLYLYLYGQLCLHLHLYLRVDFLLTKLTTVCAAQTCLNTQCV